MATLDEQVATVAAGGDRAACRALAAHGAAVIAPLAPFLERGWRAELSPASVLYMVRGPGTVDALAALARGSAIAARASAIAALGHGRQHGALAVLTALLGAAQAREDAATALGRLGDPGAVAPLRALVDQLGGLDRTALAAELAAGRTLQTADVIAAGRALARLGDPVFLPIATWLAGPGDEPQVRQLALEALDDLPSAEATQVLVAAQRDPDPDLAAAAVQAVGALGSLACVPAWLELLEQRDDLTQAIADALIALVGEAPDDLHATAEVRRWWMRTSARVSADRCVSMGAPADPGRAIAALVDREAGRDARAALTRWTGIDFVDAAEVMVPGDDDDRARAGAWWQQAAATWEVGALYRGGRKVELAPIVAALRR